MRRIAREDLSRYVTRVLKQKQMKVRDVEERSGGKISNGYVSDIMSGRQKNPSVDKLLALAVGLDVDVHELVNAAIDRNGAREYRQLDEIDPMALLELMKKVVASPHLARLLEEASALQEDELETVLRTVGRFNEFNQRTARRKRAG
jgi:transcriptional regulator with XRE-family HTH domain